MIQNQQLRPHVSELFFSVFFRRTIIELTKHKLYATTVSEGNSEISKQILSGVRETKKNMQLTVN